jgi:hypothetical protein
MVTRKSRPRNRPPAGHFCVIGIALLALWPTPEARATDYYVATNGSDSNEGTSPAAPWRTIARVNRHKFQPGDRVLLRRGDAWREQLVPSSGSEKGCVTYGAYGSGDKPALLGSVQKNRPEDWRHEGGNTWSTTPVKGRGALPCDVGNVIFDHEAACGVKVFEPEKLDTQGKFWYDERRHVLKMYSVGNPAEHYRDIECALRRHIISEGNTGFVTYENLALRYGAAHGIGGGSTQHITVRGCDISFIGGGDQHGGKSTVRFGNGVEFWGAAHDCLVERCRIWEVYDAALTNQNMGAVVTQRDITYRNNLIWNCEYSFEYWNRPAASVTRNIRFENNTCVHAGGGWGHAQRPNPGGRHLCFYSSPADAREILIRNNIFCGAANNAFFAPGYTLEDLKALRLDHNCWYQPEGVMVLLKGRHYTMAQFAAYQAATGQDAHSLTTRPGLVDPGKRDFHLKATSPCRGAGMDVGLKTDFEGTSVPQGKAPDIGAYERENCRVQSEKCKVQNAK